MLAKVLRSLYRVRGMAHITAPVHENIGDMRKKYKDKSDTFLETDLYSKEPIGLFKYWFEETTKVAGIYEANAMLLATASKDGVPSCRPVLLKAYGHEGFTFFTNYKSRKGLDLEENPRAALTFFWNSLQKVIRIEGTVIKVSTTKSDTYFHSRPRDSQIGAAISHQSEPVAGRQVLEEKFKKLSEQYPEGKEIPRPDFWGGYTVVPESIEFWQGQSDRVHDRIKFRRPKPGEEPDGKLLHAGTDGWVFERLQP